jgi:competence protein ComEC
MADRGPWIAAAAAAGVALSLSVLPLAWPWAAAGTAVALAAARGNARAWAWVALGLGMLRADLAWTRHDRLAVRSPLAVAGHLDVVAPEAGGVVVAAGERRLLISEPPPDLPPPGHRVRGLLRADALTSRADPSSFRADRWGAVRGFHGRARVLGPLADPEPAPGALAAARRAAARFREQAGARLDRGEAGPLMVALLLGDRRGLTPDDREAFRRAGLAHVLALSGMHAGVLALGAGAVARAAGLRGRAVTALVLAFLAAFAFVTGARPPILRACGTGGLAALAAAASRRARPWHSLGLVGAALLIADPLVLLDAGCRLSFVATAVLALAAARPRGRPGRLRALGGAVALSAAITVATLPEIAGSFGRVSLLSPVTNLLAGVPASAALGWGALAAVVGAVPGPGDPAAERLAGAAAAAARALLALARGAARLPGGDVALPAPGAAGAALLLLAAAAWSTGRLPRFAPRRVVAALAVLAAAAHAPRDRLTVIDVGQGNGVLVEGAGGSAMLDAGLPPYAGETAALAAARHRGRVPEVLLATHAHADHAGGLADLIATGRPRRLVVPRRAGTTPEPLLGAVEEARARGLRILQPDERARALIPRRLAARSPWPGGLAPDESDENALSLVARWSAGRAAALLTGDLGREGEVSLLAVARPEWLRAPVLLAGHHGSRTSTGPELLAAASPRLLLISCGAGNPHGHPHAEVLARARAAGVAVLRTDRDGTITVTATPRGFRLRWERGFPGPRRLFPSFPLPRPRPLA